MTILEALIKLRDDIKIWVTNNLRALNDKKLDITTAEETYAKKTELQAQLPTVTTSDAGKVLRVSDAGTWAAESLPLYDGGYTDLVQTDFTITFYGVTTLTGAFATISYGDVQQVVRYEGTEQSPNPITGTTSEPYFTLSFGGGVGDYLYRVKYTTDGTNPHTSENAIVLLDGSLIDMGTTYDIPVSSNIGIYIQFED